MMLFHSPKQTSLLKPSHHTVQHSHSKQIIYSANNRKVHERKLGDYHERDRPACHQADHQEMRGSSREVLRGCPN